MLTRRTLLTAGALGFSGVTLASLLRAEQAGRRAPPAADACILLFLNGGPSHLDMWDMKPSAPEGIRGEFRPIATPVPGLQVCEHLPRLARQMDRFSVVRSMHHRVNNAHAEAVYASMTGHDRGDATRAVGAGGEDYPTLGAVLQHVQPTPRDHIPHVLLPYRTQEGAGGPPQPGFYGGFLGQAYDPLMILKDPNQPDFNVPELTLSGDVSQERLAQRRKLLATVGHGLGTGPQRRAVDALDQFQQRALDLLVAPRVRSALDLERESAATRDRYGRNIYGQSTLLARRLIEAGTRVVTLSWAPHANATWDTHGKNFVTLRDTLLPQLDAACASLVDDLVERGLWERTVVAVFGDFGRTPKINANAGRDHWNYCYSLMLGGARLKGGFVHGASDAIGAFPARDAQLPGDVLATIMQQLGLDHDQVLFDNLGRPHRMIHAGTPIGALRA